MRPAKWRRTSSFWRLGLLLSLFSCTVAVPCRCWLDMQSFLSRHLLTFPFRRWLPVLSHPNWHRLVFTFRRCLQVLVSEQASVHTPCSLLLKHPGQLWPISSCAVCVMIQICFGLWAALCLPVFRGPCPSWLSRLALSFSSSSLASSKSSSMTTSSTAAMESVFCPSLLLVSVLPHLLSHMNFVMATIHSITCALYTPESATTGQAYLCCNWSTGTRCRVASAMHLLTMEHCQSTWSLQPGPPHPGQVVQAS